MRVAILFRMYAASLLLLAWLGGPPAFFFFSGAMSNVEGLDDVLLIQSFDLVIYPESRIDSSQCLP